MQLTHREIAEWLRSREYTPGEILDALPALVRAELLCLRYANISGGPFSIRSGADIHIDPRASVEIGRYVRFLRDFTGRFNGKLAIGNNVFFNRGCYVSVQSRVSIGDNCLFGEYVSIHDENHVASSDSTPMDERGYTVSPISIGNNVWLGAKCTVVAGVSIGDNAVVGANAVVTHDLPESCVAVGIPARVIRYL